MVCLPGPWLLLIDKPQAAMTCTCRERGGSAGGEATSAASILHRSGDRLESATIPSYRLTARFLLHKRESIGKIATVTDRRLMPRIERGRNVRHAPGEPRGDASRILEVSRPLSGQKVAFLPATDFFGSSKATLPGFAAPFFTGVPVPRPIEPAVPDNRFSGNERCRFSL